MTEKQAPKDPVVEIDGKSITAKPGQMLIQVADENHVYIPRFCYHKKLSVAANCRMCLVDVEGARKPSPACCTPVADGMKVNTKSPTTLAYQKHIMEFLLINHPLDCPICDQGGECELQDLAMGYGYGYSNYEEKKRVLPDPELGPLVSTDMTRCIDCTRCVRFGEEIAGMRELGATNRGDRTQIGTYVAKTLESELSGNIIDICPVGALTSKPFRFEARAWELQQRPTISQGDGVGANIFAHSRRGEVMRVVPRENEAINEVWLSDRDRFAYEGLNAGDRITEPMIRKQGSWQTVSWEEAMELASMRLREVADENPHQIGALAAEMATSEELYLLQKLVRRLGSNNVDSRLKQADLSIGASAGEGLDCDFATLEQADLVLLAGSFLRKEVPLLNHRIHKATQAGAPVYAFNSVAYDFNYDVETLLTPLDELGDCLAGLLKALTELAPEERQAANISVLIKNADSTDDDIRHLAEALLKAANPVVLAGHKAVSSPEYGRILMLVRAIKAVAGANGGVVGFGANSVGAEQAGFLPYRDISGSQLEDGLDAQRMLSEQSGLKALLLLHSEPERDAMYGGHSRENLAGVSTVISLSAFASEAHKQYADIILPITPFTETHGSFVNYSGLSQSFNPVVQPQGEAKPGWKVLRVLGNFLEYDDFGYNSIDEVREELTRQVHNVQLEDRDIVVAENQHREGLAVEPGLSMYDQDMITRRSQPLQQTPDHRKAGHVYVSQSLARTYNLESGSSVIVSYPDTGKRYEVTVYVEETRAARSMVIPFSLFDPWAVAAETFSVEKRHEEVS